MSEAYEETLDGEICRRRPPGPRHEEICRRLHERVAASLAGLTAARLLAPRSPVQLSGTTQIRPDLALVTVATNKLWLAAEIVSSEDHHPDTVIKKTLFEEMNLPRLWMIDPRYDNVEVYHGGEYGLSLKEILALRETLIEPLLPQFRFIVAELFNGAPAQPGPMKLNHGRHLAYCTNVHRGEDWRETFAALQTHTLAVRQRVCPDRPYAIGLRLSHQAAQELSAPGVLREFQKWLQLNNCYVFTINGFPYGRFHGTRVKEQVYSPDWTTTERLAYTNLLFDILAQILPAGVEGSVSTLPGSFKEFITSPEQGQSIRDNLWRSVEHIAGLSQRTGQKLHLGLEPEPLGWFETSDETIRFFESLRAEHPGDPRLDAHLGINYDTCHLAVEFEEPGAAMAAFAKRGIRISKLHLSSALKLRPTESARRALARFADDVYLHQVIARTADGRRLSFKDLGPALASKPASEQPEATEWRVHFHIPFHAPATNWYENTTDHVLGVLDWLRLNPNQCAHLEMETYTWEVLPPELKNRSVVDQLVAEYDWTLARLAERGLA